MTASMELPLVVFTVLAQASVGLVVVSLVRMRMAGGRDVEVKKEWAAAGALLAVALGASLAHLGHPLSAPMALKHLATSWLSREVLTSGVFLGLVAVGALVMRGAVSVGLASLASLVGLGVLLVMGMTYSPPSFPALNNALPFLFFALTAAILGTAIGAVLVPRDEERLLAGLLTKALLVALVIYLAAPCVWLSGGTVMAATGKAWIASPAYWVHVLLGLGLPLLVVARLDRVPSWLPVLLVVGELMGRAVFFSETLHTAANIGGIY